MQQLFTLTLCPLFRSFLFLYVMWTYRKTDTNIRITSSIVHIYSRMSVRLYKYYHSYKPDHNFTYSGSYGVTSVTSHRITGCSLLCPKCIYHRQHSSPVACQTSCSLLSVTAFCFVFLAFDGRQLL